MHCETTKDKAATWKESWRTLERYYSEGLIMSIGVSNFDIDLLNELKDMATVMPHVVQNWAQPGDLDLAVRQFCKEHHILYQPYASMRNIRDLSSETRTTLQSIARQHGKSEYATTLRFFLQTGAAMIPRSSKSENLVKNINTFDWRLSDEDMQRLGWTIQRNEAFSADL